MMHFPHSQIITLIECLVYSLAYVDKNKIKHHDFYPTNIFYQNGIFKIANPLIVENSGYELTHKSKNISILGKRFSFLSPELIVAVL